MNSVMNRGSIIVLVILFLFGVVVGSANVIPRPRLEWSRANDPGGSYEPARRHAQGREVVLIAIVSSTCHWSNLPDVTAAVRAAKLLVKRQAGESGLSFAAIGVAKDVSAQEGLRHLTQHGRFDEVSAGRGWYNTSILRFIYGDIAGFAATPQLIVLEQRVLFDAGTRRVQGRRELTRIVGAKDIVGWVAQGSPVQLTGGGAGRRAISGREVDSSINSRSAPGR